MPVKQQHKDTVIIITARLIGGVSLLFYGLFLFFGACPVIDMQLSEVTLIRWNTGLSVLFFLQHSVLVRRSLRARLARYLPGHYHDACYAIASGVVLTAVVAFWQPSDTSLLRLHGMSRGIARGIFLLAAAGFAWGVRSLVSLDAFGETPLKARRLGHSPDRPPFSVSGPYLWVRHPLYLFTLLLIWSCPDLTIDRLFFNVLWTAWIYIGTCLEERDLVAAYGDKYRHYQREVPMLIPWKGPVRQTF